MLLAFLCPALSWTVIRASFSAFLYLARLHSSFPKEPSFPASPSAGRRLCSLVLPEHACLSSPHPQRMTSPHASLRSGALSFLPDPQSSTLSLPSFTQLESSECPSLSLHLLRGFCIYSSLHLQPCHSFSFYWIIPIRM